MSGACMPVDHGIVAAPAAATSINPCPRLSLGASQVRVRCEVTSPTAPRSPPLGAQRSLPAKLLPPEAFAAAIEATCNGHEGSMDAGGDGAMRLRVLTPPISRTAVTPPRGAVRTPPRTPPRARTPNGYCPSPSCLQAPGAPAVAQQPSQVWMAASPAACGGYGSWQEAVPYAGTGASATAPVGQAVSGCGVMAPVARLRALSPQDLRQGSSLAARGSGSGLANAEQATSWGVGPLMPFAAASGSAGPLLPLRRMSEARTASTTPPRTSQRSCMGISRPCDAAGLPPQREAMSLSPQPSRFMQGAQAQVAVRSSLPLGTTTAADDSTLRPAVAVAANSSPPRLSQLPVCRPARSSMPVALMADRENQAYDVQLNKFVHQIRGAAEPTPLTPTSGAAVPLRERSPSQGQGRRIQWFELDAGGAEAEVVGGARHSVAFCGERRRPL
eukprot:TRINITY_DN4767_c0_g6_i1.p1 TRINITY_DN4767_c0_g6~~TRINITY_DN4767_c0_g6_i1.p1  ORF type:complete len:444 (-),score=61.49 TRINITY_DN4767_c0_g6_i1:202-1533(-)